MDLCFANMLNYGISLFSVFSLKTLLEESSRVRARQVRQTVEFTGKLLRIRRSLEQHDRLCWPVREHSNESWNLFVKRSIPRALSPVLENFRLRFSRPN